MNPRVSETWRTIIGGAGHTLAPEWLMSDWEWLAFIAIIVLMVALVMTVT